MVVGTGDTAGPRDFFFTDTDTDTEVYWSNCVLQSHPRQHLTAHTQNIACHKKQFLYLPHRRLFMYKLGCQ